MARKRIGTGEKSVRDRRDVVFYYLRARAAVFLEHEKNHRIPLNSS